MYIDNVVQVIDLPVEMQEYIPELVEDVCVEYYIAQDEEFICGVYFNYPRNRVNFLDNIPKDIKENIERIMIDFCINLEKEEGEWL